MKATQNRFTASVAANTIAGRLCLLSVPPVTDNDAIPFSHQTGAQVSEGAPGAVSNTEFLRALAWAIFTLAISAALLVTAYITLSPELAPQREKDDAGSIRTIVIGGADLIIRAGTGERADKNIVLTGLAQDGRAIVTRNTSLNAGDYPFAEYAMTGVHPGERIYLLWRTAENRGEVSRAELHWNREQAASYHLAQHEEWKGHIVEVGFDIYGDMRGQELVISSLSFLPGTWRQLLSTVWSQWTVFRGWSQRSANRLVGSPENPILPLTLAMGAWSGLALLLLAAFTRSRNLVAYCVAIVIPWMALDLLWQSELSTQFAETKYLFAGKTQYEKHLADIDSELYLYTEYLKNEVLPAPGVRIFLLHDSERETYARLKAQYYLLPHNVYNYDRFPRKKVTREGDYILVQGPVDGLNFDPATSTLNWKKRSLLVKPIDMHPQGNLYRVEAGFK